MSCAVASRARALTACAPLLALLASAGCEGTEVGNPVEESQLALTLSSSRDDVRVGEDAPDAGAGALVITEAWIVLGDLRFVLDDDCSADRDTRVTVRGPTFVQLAPHPARLRALLADGAYCRVRMPLDRAATVENDAPDELLGYSVLVSGHAADGTPFELRSRLKRELEVRTRGEPFVVSEASRALILAFDAALWLDGVAPSADTSDAGAASTSPELDLRTFEANVQRSLRLYRDSDGDGVLDPEDLADELAVGP